MRVTKCDNCKEEMVSITVSHGWQSQFDEEVHDFCSIECMIKYYFERAPRLKQLGVKDG
jgi:hypothetical protein